MNFSNLRITSKLCILLAMTLLGLCVAGVLAGYMMQREMLSARIEQTKAIVETTRTMALALQKKVDAGALTKDAAIAEFASRVNTMRYDNGNGYFFGGTMGYKNFKNTI